ncbi:MULTISPECIES: fasciclin domain-containing protein [Sphingomonas]|uniref:fasciclin domain-containing protein n=1 Tax=Sphingomonas TaxID=13687 RepID=UPI000DF013F9|nr:MULTISPECIES: fasciclin domain-containing protein [Sphingomonas]
MTLRIVLLVAATAGLAACHSAKDGNTAAPDGNSATAARPAAAKGTIADSFGKPDTSRFAAAVKAAGMDGVFKGPGPYTVFMPTDAAFMSAGDLGTNKQALVKLISGHVLPGTVLAEDIGHAIDANNGKALLKTMAGDTLTATRDGDRIKLAGPSGSATVSGADEVYGNGVVHHVDAVLKPAAK